MPSWSETLDSFRTARESWDLLHSHDGLETGKQHFCPCVHPSLQHYIIQTQQLQVYSYGFFSGVYGRIQELKVLIIC